jgi:hypothetical protein
MEDRRITLIIVPHGDLETRNIEVSYRKLKLIVGSIGALLLIFVLMAATWFYLATQVARVPGLEQQVRHLQDEQAKLAELARTLTEVEAQYERVRQLLGADATPQGKAPYLPPLRPREGQTQKDTAAAGTRPSSAPGNLLGSIGRKRRAL